VVFTEDLEALENRLFSGCLPLLPPLLPPLVVCLLPSAVLGDHDFVFCGSKCSPNAAVAGEVWVTSGIVSSAIALSSYLTLARGGLEECLYSPSLDARKRKP